MDDLPTLARGMYNIFEEAVFPALPALPDRLQILLEAGALGARMSGSGAAVFGLFVSAADAARAAEALRRQGADVWLASPIR